MKPIATDIYTFSNLIARKCLYVDKTGILADLVSGRRGKQFFFSRPRRFGKSLTVTTLQAIFEGRRDLFGGLAIDRSDYDWKAYPVIRLDMSLTPAETVEDFHLKANEQIRMNRDRLGLSFDLAASADVSFSRLVEKAAASSGTGLAVLLVDEYDKPLLRNLNTPAVRSFRDALKAFYSVIKTLEGKQRFTFITGISKFSKVSIFSDLNNLKDRTMELGQATLFGYTPEEVTRFLPGLLHRFAEANGWTDERGLAEIERWYDGYRFHPAAERVINPVSLGCCLESTELRNYWSATAMTTFLMDALKKAPLNFAQVDVDESVLGTYEPDRADMTTLLFQTGYLTITGFRWLGRRRLYTLGFPNEEVSAAFNESLVREYVALDDLSYTRVKVACWRALERHDPEAFFEAMKPVFADIPYDLTDHQNEQTWQAILVVIMRFLGLKVIPESRTNKGRIDFVMEFPHEVYVAEVKLDRTAQEAIDQIKKNGYAEKYRASGKRITLLGLNFSSERREIDGFLAEEAR